MELNVHPWWLSFIRNLTVFSLACSTKTAIPLSSPATVPTNTSGGFSGSAGLAGSTGLAMTCGAATMGGRREGEKIGRSRVIDNLDSGMAKTGLPMEVVASDGFFCGSGVVRPISTAAEFTLWSTASAPAGEAQIVAAQERMAKASA
ncbi:MAG: hypothetical protein WCA54_16470 [Pseudolabrys sp.]